MALKDPRQGAAQKMASGTKAENRKFDNKKSIHDAGLPLNQARSWANYMSTPHKGKPGTASSAISAGALNEATGKVTSPAEMSSNKRQNKPMSDARKAALLKKVSK
jgi:hypothetical protein